MSARLTAFIIVLTIFCGTACVKDKTIRCPDQACVDEVRAHARAEPAISMIRVFKAGEYGPLELSGKTIWAPIISETKG